MWSFGRVVPWLLAAPAPTTKKWDPQTTYDLTGALKQIYTDLEKPGARCREISPHLRFDYVTPPTRDGRTTWTQPHSDFVPDPEERRSKPIALFLPGLDGYGISAARNQFDDMAKNFEFWRMTVLAEDRSSFTQMVNNITKFVWDVSEGSNRKVVLIGESCGGLLAAAAAIKLCRRQENPLQGLVLVNPATSFDRTAWDSLVPLLTLLPSNGAELSDKVEDGGVSPYGLVGSLTLSLLVPDNDQRMRILESIIGLPTIDVPPRNQQQLDDVWGATSEGFRVTENRLPAELLRFRVSKWLDVGDSIVNDRLGEIGVPTLMVVGEEDALVPSAEEADRLMNVIPASEKLVVPKRGHFVLDDSVNLTEAIIYSDIDPFYRKNKPRYDPIRDWKPPSSQVIKDAIEDSVEPLRRALSPVFFSTDENGKRWRGLSKLPEKTGPLLFVGNHQLLGLDLRLVVPELFEQRGLFPRGLAHPIAVKSANASELLGRTPGLSTMKRSASTGTSDFELFGAVEVTPRNYYRLMQTNQTIILFPGGAREALIGDTTYPLYWTDKTDFVRTAARFNATIVPFSGIGVADSANVLLKYQDIQRVPVLRDWMNNFTSSVSSARYDQRNTSDFLPDIVAPSMPQRNYYMFGQAIDASQIDHKDLEQCQSLYQHLYHEVRDGIDELIQARKRDPFANTPTRVLYERVFDKQAPTFPISELEKRP